LYHYSEYVNVMIMCGLARKIHELLGTRKFILFVYCMSCDPFFASDRTHLIAGPVGKKFPVTFRYTQLIPT